MTEELFQKIMDNMTMENMIDIINILKEEGVLAQGIRVEKKENKIEYLGTEIRKPDDMKKILEMVKNSFKTEAKEMEETKIGFKTEAKEMEEMKKNILIGTEFTFVKLNENANDEKNEWDFSIKDLQEGNNEKRTQITQAYEGIKAWITQIGNVCKGCKQCKNKQCKNKQWNVGKIEKTNGQKKHSSEYYNAEKITFTFCAERRDSVKWSINFDLDPMCIELQTDPASYLFYFERQEILDCCIFKGTSYKPLISEKGGGGGHISLDFETAFLNDPYYLKNFLVLYAYAVANGQKNLIQCKDRDNAPFMHENGCDEIDEFIKVIREFNQLPKEEATVDKLVQAINKRVYVSMSEVVKRQLRESQKGGMEDKELIRLAPHYQAVNLEHIGSGCNETKWRVEMRRFEAQNDIGELLTELEALYEILQKSRNHIKLNLKKDGKNIDLIVEKSS